MRRSSSPSIAAAASAMADFSASIGGGGSGLDRVAGLVAGKGLGRRLAVRPDHDLVDLGLRLAQFLLAMLLQERAALIGADRVLELAAALFERAHDLLELGQCLLEAQLGDVGR